MNYSRSSIICLYMCDNTFCFIRYSKTKSTFGSKEACYFHLWDILFFFLNRSIYLKIVRNGIHRWKRAIALLGLQNILSYYWKDFHVFQFSMNTNDWFGGRQAVEQKYHTAKKFVIEYTQRSAAPNKKRLYRI